MEFRHHHPNYHLGKLVIANLQIQIVDLMQVTLILMILMLKLEENCTEHLVTKLHTGDNLESHPRLKKIL